MSHKLKSFALTWQFSIALMALGVVAGSSEAKTLFWARSSDVQTLDPDAYNEGITHAFNVNIYESLTTIDPNGKVIPGLATEWRLLPDDPTVWEFKLRKGVTFHDGAPLTADDVVFSFQRVTAPTSGLRSYFDDVVSVKAVDDYTVWIKSKNPNLPLINDIWAMWIMNRAWCEKHGTTAPQDFKSKEDSYASTHENGTGPYRLVSREPDRRTELVAYEGYWGKKDAPLDVDRIVYTPIQAAATRISALASGDVNFVQDVPPQDVPKLEANSALRVSKMPEARTVFLGMNIGAKKLTHGQADGNPFADLRVRQAMDLAIDRKAIQSAIMRGLSIPSSTIQASTLPSFTDALKAPTEPNIDEAKRLMSAAEYGKGFKVTLDCTNGGTVNDERICQALVGMFAKIGIQVSLNVQPAGIIWPEITKKNTDFYLTTWGGAANDLPYLKNLVHSGGTWAAINYKDAKLDAEIDGLSSITDEGKYVKMVSDVWEKVRKEKLYLPIHQQVLVWATSSDFTPELNVSNRTFVKNFKLNR